MTLPRWVFGVALLGAAACGGAPCEPTPLVGAMTVARARRLAPEIETGVAVSSKRDLGRCPSERPHDPCGAPSCGAIPWPVRVWLVALPDGRVDLPVDPRCEDGFAVTAVDDRASVEGATSEARGEGVLEAAPGLHLLAFAPDGAACARCSAAGRGESCLVEVPPGGVAVRDLVF